MRSVVLWAGSALVCAMSLHATAQSSGTALVAAATNPPNVVREHSTIELDGPWRFQVGDDPRSADVNLNDSTWVSISISKPLTEQGIDTYNGYAWYRLKLDPQQVARFGNPSTGLDLFVTGARSVGQLAVYVNGTLLGHTDGMTDQPTMYDSPPLIVHLPQPGSDGAMVIAIRSWAGSSVTIGRGLVDRVEVGPPGEIARMLTADTEQDWNQHVSAGVLLSFLFFCVALLGATLYLAQRKHAEYLWLSLLCLTVSLMGGTETAFHLGWMSYTVFRVFNLWASRLFMAATLEFILRFTDSDWRRLVRIVQICVVILPVLSLLQLEKTFEYLSVTAEIVFSALVTVLLFRAWRKGRPDAGVMLLPFFLAATADSLDTVLGWAADQHWVPNTLAYHHFHFGPVEFGVSVISYSVFLFSLLAVIFYRFIHVSQEEQRSSAEIEAARSVQAMLIPTQLPSNHNFMLESAYLPANGVGGDFFQVLPLKDDSMLIVVGDVSGKGLQAAMNASTLVGALRNELSHDPATILNRLNNVLLGATQETDALPNLKGAVSFATCVCARVYTDGTMTIANAGHLHPYRDGRELELAADLPLGVVPNIEYEQAAFQLNVGDRLIFLSDGVVEASNAHGELFGFERTQQVSNESARYIAQTAKRFGQTDDITVVSLYFAARTAQKVARGVPVQV
jgi:hypothetical protein